MIKAVWSTYYNCWVAVDDKDLFHQKKGISKANAISRLKNASPTSHFRLTEEDMKAMRAACTPPSSS